MLFYSHNFCVHIWREKKISFVFKIIHVTYTHKNIISNYYKNTRMISRHRFIIITETNIITKLSNLRQTRAICRIKKKLIKDYNIMIIYITYIGTVSEPSVYHTLLYWGGIRFHWKNIYFYSFNFSFLLSSNRTFEARLKTTVIIIKTVVYYTCGDGYSNVNVQPVYLKKKKCDILIQRM